MVYKYHEPFDVESRKVVQPEDWLPKYYGGLMPTRFRSRKDYSQKVTAAKEKKNLSTKEISEQTGIPIEEVVIILNGEFTSYDNIKEVANAVGLHMLSVPDLVAEGVYGD